MITPDHKYYALKSLRLHVVPQDGLMYIEAWNTCRYVAAIKAPAFGYAVYSRELTEVEMSEYNLVPAANTRSENA